MSSSVAQILGLPPGVHFRPDSDELVGFYLLSRARGEPAPFPGAVVIEDDTAANTLPWKLLERHGLAGDDEAYFFVRTNGANNEAARQDRYCAGGGTWVSQRPMSGASCVGGEKIQWRRSNLNLQMGRGKKGGSTGWVMHEYTLTEPPCPFLKICCVKFSGYGKERKRVPNDEPDCQAASEPASKRARVTAANNSGSSSKTTISDQEPSVGRACLTDQAFSAAVHHQQQMVMMTPLPDDCRAGDPAANSSSVTTTLADQDSGAYAGLEPAQATDEEIFQWLLTTAGGAPG